MLVGDFNRVLVFLPLKLLGRSSHAQRLADRLPSVRSIAEFDFHHQHLTDLLLSRCGLVIPANKTYHLGQTDIQQLAAR